MKRKYIILFMYVFTSLCIFSVGFASWTFVSGDSINASGSIVAEDVISSNDYIYIDNPQDISLDYYETGFVDNEGFISLTGTIDVIYTIDVDKCKEIYPNDQNLFVIISLDAVGFNIFDKVSSSHEIYNYDSSISQLSSTAIQNSNKYQMEITLNDLLLSDVSVFSFSITYKFTTSSHQDFRKNIYPNMNSLHFTTTTLVNGD